MKVLIVKLSSLGDVVHTLPALNALRWGFSGSDASVEIDWLVEEAASGIIEGHPMIDEVIVVKRDGWIKSPKENHRTARRLAAKGYDIVLDFQGLLKSGVWVLLSKGRRRIGFSNAREMSHIFLTEKVTPTDKEMHAVDRYLLLVNKALGVVDTGPVEFPVHIDEGSLDSVRAKLSGSGVVEPFVTLLPGARWDTKLWSIEGFAELATAIKERLGLSVVLVGSEVDFEMLEEIRKSSKEAAANLAGKTDLKELAALLSLSRFVVTVDSGPMHIAAALSTPVVALFGPTAAARTGPYGKGHIIIKRDLDCAPCFMRKCPDPRCMELITANDVMESILNSSIVASGHSGVEPVRA